MRPASPGSYRRRHGQLDPRDSRSHRLSGLREQHRADAGQGRPDQGPPSYSRSNLVLANVGNAVYSVYVFTPAPWPHLAAAHLLHPLLGADARLEPALRPAPQPRRAPCGPGRHPSRRSAMRTHDTSTSRPSSSGPARPASPPGTTSSGPAGRSSSSTARAGSATGGASSGTACACSPRPGRTASPGMPNPAPALVVPDQGRVRRLPRVVCRALRPSRAGRPRRVTSGGAPRRRLRRDRRRRARSSATTSSCAPGPSGARRGCPASPTSSTRRSGSCTRASTGGRPSCADGTGARRRRLPLRLRHRLRGSPRRTRRCCAARTPADPRRRSTRRCSRWSSPPCCSCSGTS